MSFSFIHLADIHLGRPFSGLSEFSQIENKENLYESAVEKSLEKVFKFALEKQVDFILISGDTFDSCEYDFSSKLIFKNFLKKSEKENIQIFVVCGNHDPVFAYNENTFNFDENSKVKIIGLNTSIREKLPFYKKDNQIGGFVYSVSFQEEKFNGNLLCDFDSIEYNYFNIALLHCDIDANEDSNYAPCLLSELKGMGFDYCALGHIHTPKKLADNIYYSGTLQGRNIKEKGEHGIRYISVQNNKIVENNFVPMDVIRYEELEIDLSNTNDETDAFELIVNSVEKMICSQTNLCELYLLSFKLVGNVEFYSVINKSFNDSLENRLKVISSTNIFVSKIENLLTPKVDDEVLKNDEGIVSELYKLLENKEDLNELYSEIFDSISNVCNSEMDREEILYQVEQECKNLCSNIYNDKRGLNE